MRNSGCAHRTVQGRVPVHHSMTGACQVCRDSRDCGAASDPLPRSATAQQHDRTIMLKRTVDQLVAAALVDGPVAGISIAVVPGVRSSCPTITGRFVARRGTRQHKRTLREQGRRQHCSRGAAGASTICRWSVPDLQSRPAATGSPGCTVGRRPPAGCQPAFPHPPRMRGITRRDAADAQGVIAKPCRPARQRALPPVPRRHAPAV